MSGELEKLKEHRDAILLAEVAAWLHDIGKLSTQFLYQMSRTPSAKSQEFEHEKAVETIDGFVEGRLLKTLKSQRLRDLLRLNSIQNQAQIGQILDLILHHDSSKHSAFLVRLLNRCDGADSGADKGTTREAGLPKEAKQIFEKTFVATAFGYESSRLEPAQLDESRKRLSSAVGQSFITIESNINQLSTERSAICRSICSEYAKALAETRRSANDVTLWDHSFSVATLYKTALASFLINGSLDIDHLRWCILRVNFDVLSLYAKAIKIADLLGYQDKIRQACQEAKQLVEEEYPLGNEIYRDTTGIYFTFPDIELPDELSDLIRKAVEDVEPELVPHIEVDPAEPLETLLSSAHQRARKELTQPITSQNLSTHWQEEWAKADKDRTWELCPVCRLRPRTESAEVCEVCEQHRGSRVEEWKQNPAQTIWMDEIADHYDRVALLVGKFGLDDWLSGDLVQTMLVKADNDPAKCVPKNPSPARLRRVWETCQRFWTETVARILDALPQRTRWRLSMGPLPREMPEGAVCDGTLNGQPISVWRQGNHLLTISFVMEKPSGQLSVSWETGQRKLHWTGQIIDAQEADEKFLRYHPSLTLLESPDQFLALVPASDALDIIKKIKGEYEEQMGKVRNRLPLLLGLIFFPRKTPLTAVMEAARRMLEGVKFSEAEWKVSRRVDDTLQFDNGVKWHVPTKMGDGTTDDLWYPYFFVSDGVDASDRSRRFQLKKPDEQDAQKAGAVSERYADRWLVHVNDLRDGDRVCVIPSHFDFEWLDTNARRFDVSYTTQGKRRAPDKHNRPYLLDDVERFECLWQLICENLTTSQVKQLDGLIEAKRQQWEQGTGSDLAQYDEVFKQFVCDALKNVKWKHEPEDWHGLYHAALTGELHDVLQLYMGILKRKPEENQQQGGSQQS